MNLADIPAAASIPNQRALFEIPDDVAYLNCAYMSPSLNRVVAAGEKAVRQKRRPWEVTSPDFFNLPNRGRDLFAQIIGADGDGIAVIPSVSYGMAIAALNVDMVAGQEILLLEAQFPSNVYPWHEKAKQSGGIITTVPHPSTVSQNHQAWTPAILDSIGPQTAIVALPHCHWTDGSLIDLLAVGDAVRSVGAALVLDITQSAGVLPVDVKTIQPDFLVTAAYKWLLGPYSLGFIYVADHRRDGRPLEQTWSGRKGSEDFARLVNYQDARAPGVQHMDMGGKSQLHLMPMAIAAMEQILDWGVDNIAVTLAARTRDIAQRASSLGLHSVPESLRAGHYLGLKFPGGVPDHLLERLSEQKIYVSARGDSMRVTPHLYNNEYDVDRFITALESVLHPVF